MTHQQNQWIQHIEQWRKAAIAERLSRTTIRTYTSYLIQAGRAHGGHPFDASIGELRDILAQYFDQPDAQKSMRSALKHFYDWALGDGLVPTDPTQALKSVRTKQRVADPCPEDVVDQALKTAPKREQLMILLGRDCGLRASEIAKVHTRDLDHDGILKVTGKGHKERLVPVLNPILLEAIRRADGYLFPNPTTGDAMTAGHVTKLISQALPGRWTAHKLRHAFGTASAERNPNIIALAEVMGHATTNTTRGYVRTSRQALKDAVAASARHDPTNPHLRLVA